MLRCNGYTIIILHELIYIYLNFSVCSMANTDRHKQHEHIPWVPFVVFKNAKRF